LICVSQRPPRRCGLIRRLSVLAILVASIGAAETYYVDCSHGSDDAEGTSPEEAWKSLEKISGKAFSPGDSILLRRGTRCAGSLWPKGSGSEEDPIRLGAYDTGPLPLIEAGDAEAAFKLFDQSHWRIEHIETSGGSPYGILISGSKGAVRRFEIRNVVVRDVGGTVEAKGSGLVAVLAPEELRIEDVLIDGVTADGTTQWAGIIVRGGSRDNRIRNVTIRNSIVHHVYGDGIVLFQVDNGLIERSAAWLTGLQPVQRIGTPNGIWTWRCRNCIVQLTEGFLIDSPGVDGGVYDIDWGNDNNTVQYNYGHDAQGYCASVFAAGGEVTTNSVVRYNVCVDNGRSPKLALRQGDFYLSTWDGGKLDGVLVHNNTFIWNPPIDAPAVQMDYAEFTGGGANVFRNNVIVSGVPSMIHSSRSLLFENNVYWYAGRGLPRWAYGGRDFRGFLKYEAAIDAGADERFAPPALDPFLRPLAGSPLIDAASGRDEMGARDAFGAPVPRGGDYDIGAVESGAPPPVIPTPVPELTLAAVGGDDVSLARREGKWLLILFGGRASEFARGQVVFVQTALAQYGERNLDAALAAEDPADDLQNLRYDWDLGDIALLTAQAAKTARQAFGVSRGPALVLVSPSGDVVRRWEGFVSPAELGVTLRHLLTAEPQRAQR
jgi:hypothetical protein